MNRPPDLPDSADLTPEQREFANYYYMLGHLDGQVWAHELVAHDEARVAQTIVKRVDIDNLQRPR